MSVITGKIIFSLSNLLPKIQFRYPESVVTIYLSTRDFFHGFGGYHAGINKVINKINLDTSKFCLLPASIYCCQINECLCLNNRSSTEVQVVNPYQPTD